MEHTVEDSQGGQGFRGTVALSWTRDLGTFLTASEQEAELRGRAVSWNNQIQIQWNLQPAQGAEDSPSGKTSRSPIKACGGNQREHPTVTTLPEFSPASPPCPRARQQVWGNKASFVNQGLSFMEANMEEPAPQAPGADPPGTRNRPPGHQEPTPRAPGADPPGTRSCPPGHQEPTPQAPGADPPGTRSCPPGHQEPTPQAPGAAPPGTRSRPPQAPGAAPPGTRNRPPRHQEPTPQAPGADPPGTRSRPPGHQEPTPQAPGAGPPGTRNRPPGHQEPTPQAPGTGPPGTRNRPPRHQMPRAGRARPQDPRAQEPTPH
ncbi:basic proline-rich protein-like [Salarias fasciatus]|uniref:basic proline-rich protein-like n=1 Tax=Salarias fasciatus TaxID=181472 RepID=UPI0011764E1A|nr:basic proline-rich protein-like [Salarias fasciatus]